MAVIRCPRGHYYDEERFSACPHCGISTTRAEDEHNAKKRLPERRKSLLGWLERERTVALEALPEEDDQGTVGFFSGAKGNDYVTGWLVCVEGPEKGRDYRLHHGFNRIGRSVSMDIQVLDDPAVTRENHCSVVYDERKNQFSVIPSSGALTYCNGQLLTEPKPLNTGDEISLGNSRFEFIPFCREGKVWEKEDGR